MLLTWARSYSTYKGKESWWGGGGGGWEGRGEFTCFIVNNLARLLAVLPSGW